jgi:hypothetical protein
MARTQITGYQVLDQSINRDDVDITTAGKALITKILAGSGIIIDSSTGVDSGTGDVTISSTGGALFGDDLHEVFSEGETYTTSSTWVTKLNLDLTGLTITGDYIMFLNLYFLISNPNYPIDVRMVINDTTEIFNTNYFLSRINFWEQRSGFSIYTDIAQTAYNVKLQFHANNGKSVGLRRCRLIVWRIS